MEWFKREAGLNILAVPYRSSPPVYNALLSGEIQLTVAALGGATQLIESGQVKALASMSRRRPSSLPSLRTVSEAGYSEFDLVGWMGVFAPSNTPQEIVRTLEDEILRAAGSGEVREQLQRIGLEPSLQGAAEFASLVKRDIGNWAKVIQDVAVNPH
jgi:tripartite-type tricarboxylate transporter receptor subunit TctC